MAQLIDQPTASESAAHASEDANLTHRLTSAWGGVVGECGVECACGVTFDGFDRIADAEVLLNEHIEQAGITHPQWCDLARCWAYENTGETPSVGGFHESAPIVVDTLNPTGLSLHLALDHGDPDAVPEVIMCTGEPDGVECRHLSLDQAAQLYAALQVLVPGLTNAGNARSLYELGERNGRRQAERKAREAMPVNSERVDADTLAALERIKQRFDDAERETYKAYCLGWVDGMDGRAPQFGVTR